MVMACFSLAFLLTPVIVQNVCFLEWFTHLYISSYQSQTDFSLILLNKHIQNFMWFLLVLHNLSLKYPKSILFSLFLCRTWRSQGALKDRPQAMKKVVPRTGAPIPYVDSPTYHSPCSRQAMKEKYTKKNQATSKTA